MSGGVYGGDEVGAVVIDPGRCSFRFGYAGEESPKADIPSIVGVLPEIEKSQDKVTTNGSGDSNLDENVPPVHQLQRDSRYVMDTNGLYVPRQDMQMKEFLNKEGVVENMDLFEEIISYAYKQYLQSTADLHPVLLSEAPWNYKGRREQLTELFFEKFQVPAFFLVKNAVLSAFANGKSTALVLDSGMTNTAAVPVYDGFCLHQNIVKTPVAGGLITEQCHKFLDSKNVDIIPSYMVASKEAVETFATPKWTKKSGLPEVTQSYQQFMVQKVVEDFQAAVLQVNDTPYNEADVEDKNDGAMSYEFPNGYSQDISSDRITLAEGLFDTKFIKHPPQAPTPGQHLASVSQVVAASIGQCDVDIRPALYNNIVVTGGNSLVQGFVERLPHDLNLRAPSSAKVKIHAAPTPMERKFGAWIGGSILASLGSFQQMWISKQEYEESGKVIVEKKCP